MNQTEVIEISREGVMAIIVAGGARRRADDLAYSGVDPGAGNDLGVCAKNSCDLWRVDPDGAFYHRHIEYVDRIDVRPYRRPELAE